jgi:hypothetical protein
MPVFNWRESNSSAFETSRHRARRAATGREAYRTLHRSKRFRRSAAIPAGIWYLAGSNTCIFSSPGHVQTSNCGFRNYEFLVSLAVTHGCESIPHSA